MDENRFIEKLIKNEFEQQCHHQNFQLVLYLLALCSAVRPSQRSGIQGLTVTVLHPLIFLPFGHFVVADHNATQSVLQETYLFIPSDTTPNKMHVLVETNSFI
jgi:hypothetical protein